MPNEVDSLDACIDLSEVQRGPEPKCEICGDSIEPIEETHECRCGALYHLTCYDYNKKKCARMGCELSTGVVGAQKHSSIDEVLAVYSIISANSEQMKKDWLNLPLHRKAVTMLPAFLLGVIAYGFYLAPDNPGCGFMSGVAVSFFFPKALLMTLYTFDRYRKEKS